MTISDPTFDNWRTQMAIWSYAVTGRILEFSALVCESSITWEQIRAWDHTYPEVERIQIWDQGQRIPTPDWYALPWVTESRLPESVQLTGERQRKERR